VESAFAQSSYQVRFDWEAQGAAAITDGVDVVVVVDVLSFGTAVDVALGRGAEVLPQRYDDPAAARREALARDALPAGPRDGVAPSLRPSSLLGLPAGTRLALPSPNGATLCAAAAGGGAVVLAGCLRNATAVAAAAHRLADGGPVGLVPAGERWPGGTLRVAVEDAVGAGAIAVALPGSGVSPEAEAAVVQFAAARRNLPAFLAATVSGRELAGDGYGADVTLAAAHDVSSAVPRLLDGLLRDAR
jgi:2-phosphosulfolactate phosphatase